MYAVESIYKYNNNNIYFCETIKNNVIDNSYFIRIIYSSEHLSLNGIYLLFELKDVVYENYYNKYKCEFNIEKNKDVIERLKMIEMEILQLYGTNKIATHNIDKQLQSGYIKIFEKINNTSNQLFMLKISGLWETNDNYGITFKFIPLNETSL